jgi:proton-translocating NADH-quinone oxidoreductase chain N
MPSALILAPFLSLIILNLFPKEIMRKIAFGWVACLLLLQILLIVLYPGILSGAAGDPIGSFFAFELFIDALSRLLLLSIAIVVLASLTVAQYAIKDQTQRFNFTNLILIILIGMNATVIVTDLFSLYLFIEITSLSSFILISILKDKPAIEGAFKYLMLSVIASVFMLTSIAIFLLVSGGTSFAAVSDSFKNQANSLLVQIAAGLFLCALFIKSGVFPFHGWLPDAHSACPTPVSVLLSGIVVKAGGIYVLARLAISVFTFSAAMQNVLMFIGAFSIVFGALAALTQSNFKRMLAYSTVSQVGYMVLALGCFTPLALAGAVFHLFNHAIFKSLLFVNAGAVEKQTGTLDMNRMGGLSSQMPVTSTTSVIASLSAAGVPPLAGFWSKLIIILALWDAGHQTYAGIALVSSILTLAYLLAIQRKVFFGKLEETLASIKEAPLAMVLPEIVLATIIIVVGLSFPFIFNNWILPLKELVH